MRHPPPYPWLRPPAMLLRIVLWAVVLSGLVWDGVPPTWAQAGAQLRTPGAEEHVDGAAWDAVPWQRLKVPGVELLYAPEDTALAERLAPVLAEDRGTVTERLRLFPPEAVRVVLAPTTEVFADALGDLPPQGTLGVYLLGTRTLVLRSPRTLPGADWDPRGVLRHELAHAVIDMAVTQPVPLWLHEGLAILVADELDYLDEARLTTVAVLGGLIPLPVLFDRFPATHGARGLAYAQAASFVRFLLREDGRGVDGAAQGIGTLQALLRSLAAGRTTREAFRDVYGETLEELEERWQDELAGRFSVLTLVTTTSVLGGLGIPLLLAAVARRWVQRRRKFRQWEAEERHRAERLAGLWGTPPGLAAPPPDGGAPDVLRRPDALRGWRRPGTDRERRRPALPPGEGPTDESN